MAKKRGVDLFLGGPLGLWMLDQVDARDVAGVYTESSDIAEKAAALDIPIASAPAFADVGLSVHYPRLLSAAFIGQYRAIYNVHPALLPWGRGYYPVFWALWLGEPAGCTLHEIEAGIDTGPIVEQRRVPQYAWDTGGSLHQRVSEAEKGLILDYWPRLAAGELLPVTPQAGQGSYHDRAAFFALKRNAPVAGMEAANLARLIRCLSHPLYTGLEVAWGGRRYELHAEPL